MNFLKSRLPGAKARRKREEKKRRDAEEAMKIQEKEKRYWEWYKKNSVRAKVKGREWNALGEDMWCNNGSIDPGRWDDEDTNECDKAQEASLREYFEEGMIWNGTDWVKEDTDAPGDTSKGGKRKTKKRRGGKRRRKTKRKSRRKTKKRRKKRRKKKTKRRRR